MNLAIQFQFINIATLLWAANIEPAHDEKGSIITPTNSPAGWVDEGVVMYVALHIFHTRLALEFTA